VSYDRYTQHYDPPRRTIFDWLRAFPRRSITYQYRRQPQGMVSSIRSLLASTGNEEATTATEGDTAEWSRLLSFFLSGKIVFARALWAGLRSHGGDRPLSISELARRWAGQVLAETKCKILRARNGVLTGGPLPLHTGTSTEAQDRDASFMKQMRADETRMLSNYCSDAPGEREIRRVGGNK